MARRKAQSDKEARSERIRKTLADLPEFRAARTLLLYADAGSEVRTRPLLAQTLGQRTVLVPYCVDDELALFRLESMDELERGRYGIPEPRPELRSRPAKHAEPDEPDVIVVPGVAFDRSGARLGSGHGYYDRLLRQVRPETAIIGLAFECQLVVRIPVEPHDMRVDTIVTETTVYRCDDAG